jgi:hypothetical protein
MYTYNYIYDYIYILLYIYIWLYTYRWLYIYMIIYIWLYIYDYIYMITYIWLYIYDYIYEYIYMNIYIYVHISLLAVIVINPYFWSPYPHESLWKFHGLSTITVLVKWGRYITLSGQSSRKEDTEKARPWGIHGMVWQWQEFLSQGEPNSY